jgi:3'-5' exoribonuclease
MKLHSHDNPPPNALNGEDIAPTSGIAVKESDLDQYSPPEREYIELVRSLSQPFSKLFELIFDKEGLWQSFVSGPSSVRGHHSVRGGNLKHSLEVAERCRQLAQADLEIIDLDVLIAAALLHDVGKALEYERTTLGWRMTSIGQAVGHKSSTFGMVYSALERIEGFTKHQVLALCNCLSCTSSVSHDLRGPACLEAELLLKCDQMSALTDQYRDSREISGNQAGHGVRKPHLRETPFFTKPKAIPQPVRAQPRFPQFPPSNK